MSSNKSKIAAQGKSLDRSPNPIDAHVGSRIRLRRAILGLSQEKLAEELGITFQQVQKYERGLNRVGASRLWHLARVLGVNVNFFYDNFDEETQEKMSIFTTPTMLSFAEDPAPAYDHDILGRKDVLELVRHYIRINDPKIAKNVLDLVKSISAEHSDKED